MAWTKLLGFTDTPDLARAEIATFRHRASCNVAARITRAAAKRGYASTPPGAGHSPSPPPGTDSEPPSPTPELTSPRPLRKTPASLDSRANDQNLWMSLGGGAKVGAPPRMI